MITEINTHHHTGISVGVLFIIATVFLFVGGAFYGPVLDAPNFLETTYPHRINVIIGILIEFSCIIAIPLIPVFAFPVLRKHNEKLAIAYIIFRLFAAVIFLFVDVTKLSLIKVSELYLVASDAVTAETFVNIASVIQAWNEWVWIFYVLIFAVSALIFYILLYRSKLLPRWISIWGIIAIVLMASGAFLDMFDAGLPDAVYGLMAVPIAVQEMVMAVRLIGKGFNPITKTNATEKEVA